MLECSQKKLKDNQIENFYIKPKVVCHPRPHEPCKQRKSIRAFTPYGLSVTTQRVLCEKVWKLKLTSEQFCVKMKIGLGEAAFNQCLTVSQLPREKRKVKLLKTAYLRQWFLIVRLIRDF